MKHKNIWIEDPETYRRNLPHFVPEGANLFVTFRLVNSLPKSALDRLKTDQWNIVRSVADRHERDEIYDQRKRHFALLDRFLDSPDDLELCTLRKPAIARIVMQVFLEADATGEIDLKCLTIMPNHVHALFSLRDLSMRQVMQTLKGRSAIQCNRLLRRRGPFWQHESYDHVARENEFVRIIRYILLNPVKARLAENWVDYPWSYIRPDLRQLAEEIIRAN